LFWSLEWYLSSDTIQGLFYDMATIQKTFLDINGKALPAKIYRESRHDVRASIGKELTGSLIGFEVVSSPTLSCTHSFSERAIQMETF
jgi:hypothetical protein